MLGRIKRLVFKILQGSALNTYWRAYVTPDPSWILGTPPKLPLHTPLVISAHQHAAITNGCLAMAGLGSEATPATGLKHKENRPRRKLRDESSVQAISSALSAFHNPFSVEHSGDLCNLTTGAVAPAAVADDLEEAYSIGERLFLLFVKERLGKNNNPIDLFQRTQ